MKKNILEDKKKIEAVLTRCKVDFAYQFGSSVTGNFRRESDIDIAIFLNVKLSVNQRFQTRLRLIEELSKVFKRQTEVVVLNDVRSLFFKYVIVKEGKIIFSRAEDKRADFECRVLSLYFDYEPFSNLYNKNYVQVNI